MIDIEFSPTLHRKWWLPVWVKYSRTGQQSTDNQTIINARLSVLQYFDFLLVYLTITCHWSFMQTSRDHKVYTCCLKFWYIDTKLHRKTELFLMCIHAKYGDVCDIIRSNPGGSKWHIRKKNLKKILSPKIHFEKSFWGQVMNLGA